MSNQAVGTVYQIIIDEVINTSRVDFEESGVEESVLEELRQVSRCPIVLLALDLLALLWGQPGAGVHGSTPSYKTPNDISRAHGYAVLQVQAACTLKTSHGMACQLRRAEKRRGLWFVVCGSVVLWLSKEAGGKAGSPALYGPF